MDFELKKGEIPLSLYPRRNPRYYNEVSLFHF